MAVQNNILTIQSDIKQHRFDSLTEYALFLGGTNVTHDVLQCYDPLKNGWGRIFMVRKPVFIEKLGTQDSRIAKKFAKFKHILEYGNTAIGGLNNIDVNFASVEGGYSGRGFQVPTHAQDTSDTLTISTYEFSGSPMREMLHFWINGVTDIQSTFSHYYGVDIDKIQANHTAEFIYVMTDQSGQKIEYACQWCNCFPKSINLDNYNTESGSHEVAKIQIDFDGIKYESPQINRKATELLERYKIMVNSLDFNGGNPTNYSGAGNFYNKNTGKLDTTNKWHGTDWSNVTK